METDTEKDVRNANEFMKALGIDKLAGFSREQILKVLSLIAIYPEHLEQKGVIKFTAKRDQSWKS